MMPNYRIVTIDEVGKPGRHRGFVCENDQDAIVWAKQLLDEAPIELWSGARFVIRLDAQSALKNKRGWAVRCLEPCALHKTSSCLNWLISLRFSRRPGGRHQLGSQQLPRSIPC